MRIDCSFRQILGIIAITIFGLFAINTSAKAQDWIMEKDWTLVPSSCCVVEVAWTPDGKLMGVGADENIYVWNGAGWTLVDASGAVTSVIIAQDGRIIGNGSDGHLYTKLNWGDPWQLARNSYGTNTIAQKPDGTFLGRGGDSLLYTKRDLASNWVAHPAGGNIINADSTADGTIIGVGIDNSVYYVGTDNKWVLIPQTWGVGGFATHVSGTFYATGTDDHLYVSNFRRTGDTAPATPELVTSMVVTGKWNFLKKCSGSACGIMGHKVTTGVSAGKEVSSSSTVGKALSVMVGTEASGSVLGVDVSAKLEVTGTASSEQTKTIANSFSLSKSKETEITCVGPASMWQWASTLTIFKSGGNEVVIADAEMYVCASVDGKPDHLDNINWSPS